MKVEALIFNLIAVFCLVAGDVYGFWSREPIGTTALMLSGGLTGLIGGFFWFVSRASTPAPRTARTPTSPTVPASSASSAPAATGRSRWPPRPRSWAWRWRSSTRG